MANLILGLVAKVYALVRDGHRDDDPALRRYIASMSTEQQARLTHVLSRVMGTKTESTPADLAAYQAKRARMMNILEMLWPVQLTVNTPDGYQMALSYIVSAQPDPKAPGWWYVRLPSWKLLRFKPTEELDPMHRLVEEDEMQEFFDLQADLLFAELEWKGIANAMHYQQAMIASYLSPSGELIRMSHEPFDESQVARYHLEDERTRRKDYEWGRPGDPLDAHRPGKITRKKLIEGELPIDIGRITVDGIELDTESRDDKAILADIVRHGRVVLSDYVSQKKRDKWQMEALDSVAELTCVGLPDNFSTVKRMSTIFRVCRMHKNVREKFQERLWNAPYWRVKDKRRQRWYVYSYDWRTHKRAYSHAVIPIGHIEPARHGDGYYFCMYSEATLAQRNQQSLYIADYRVRVTFELARLMDLDFDLVDTWIEFSVYNDWAMALFRQHQLPASPKLFPRSKLAHLVPQVVCA